MATRVHTCDQDYRTELTDALAAFGTRVHAAQASNAWTAPSPCDGWSAADVARHVIGSVYMFAAATGDGAQQPAASEDLAQYWAEARSVADRVLGGIEDPAATIPMVLGSRQVTAGFVVEALLRDVVIHTWDLARAVGGDEKLPPHLVTAATAALMSVPEHIRQRGLYADALDVPSDADDLTRLIALAGRRP